MDINIKAQQMLTAFHQRSGYFTEHDVFNEILLSITQKNLSDADDQAFQSCRTTLRIALNEARSGQFSSPNDLIQKVLRTSESLSMQCRLLIHTFANGALAYLRYRNHEVEEGKRLLLEALIIDNYLIHEHGYWILEMHRVQLLHNLIRVVARFENPALAIHLLGDLLDCFYTHQQYPKCYQNNDMELFRSTFLQRADLPITELLPDSAIERFDIKEPQETALLPPMKSQIRTIFWLDFSDLSQALIIRMYDQLIAELASLTGGDNRPKLIEMLRSKGINDVEDLVSVKQFQVGYLWHSIKLHSEHARYEELLADVQALCTISIYPSIWKSVADDLQKVCHEASGLDLALKHRIATAIELEQTQ